MVHKPEQNEGRIKMATAYCGHCNEFTKAPVVQNITHKRIVYSAHIAGFYRERRCSRCENIICTWEVDESYILDLQEDNAKLCREIVNLQEKIRAVCRAVTSKNKY
jgi:hypothetical protein